MKAQGGNWGICGVSLRNATVRDQLAPQDHAYTSVTLAPDGPQENVIEVIDHVLVAPENPPRCSCCDGRTGRQDCLNDDH